MGAERCKKSAKAHGGIECDSMDYRKSGSQIADRKRVETKSSVRRFTDRASGAAGGGVKFFARKREKSIYKFRAQAILNLTSKF